jgi:outer membrane protein assembly factor BamD
MIVKQLKILLAVGVLCGAVTACSSDKKSEEAMKDRPLEELYTEARAFMAEGKYAKAAESFDEVERQHPFSQWAPRSQIMAAFSQYKAQKYDDAILTLARFTEMYPSHERLDYAYYLTALCYYEQISDVGRDQGITRKAAKALTDVVKRFPQSSYARDAQIKLDLTKDHLAGKEMMIGRYYLGQQEYLSAASRFRTVVEQFDTTTHAPEALHRLVEVYLLLGVKEEAEHYAAVLGHNFPESEWYERSYALLRGSKNPNATQKKSWWKVL